MEVLSVFTGTQGLKKTSIQKQLCKEREAGPSLGLVKEKEMTRNTYLEASND